MIRIALVLLLALSTVAAAQQPADPAALQRALAVLQQQRNQAMDLHANAEMRVMQLTEELAKAKAELEQARKATPIPVPPSRSGAGAPAR